MHKYLTILSIDFGVFIFGHEIGLLQTYIASTHTELQERLVILICHLANPFLLDFLVPY